MSKDADIEPDSSDEEEADRASRELGQQIENARRLLREYQSGIHRPTTGEDKH